MEAGVQIDQLAETFSRVDEPADPVTAAQMVIDRPCRLAQGVLFAVPADPRPGGQPVGDLGMLAGVTPIAGHGVPELLWDAK
jgi:hypothetical protein